MLKVLVIGAGGIIGQHMMVSQPEGVSALYARRTEIPGKYIKWYFPTYDALPQFDGQYPDVVINLAGENRVDVVEASPKSYEEINVKLPGALTRYSQRTGTRYIQVSTQGVFSGDNAPYDGRSIPHPITEYGKQKKEAEEIALATDNSTIARLTFVLGVRPFQDTGRRNPLEDMLEKSSQLQVDDRWFSPCFAHDAARVLWDEILNPKGEKIFHIGHPFRMSRFTIASALSYNLHGAINPVIKPISHEFFSGLAERPINTQWAQGSRYYEDFEDSLITSFIQWKKLQK